jgi:uncharacterized protein YjeT (DUF2065 family)
MGATLLAAFGLMLVIEGLGPFVAPAAWREMFRRVLAFSDGQLRFAGLVAMLAGAALVALAR